MLWDVLAVNRAATGVAEGECAPLSISLATRLVSVTCLEFEAKGVVYNTSTHYTRLSFVS